MEQITAPINDTYGHYGYCLMAYRKHSMTVSTFPATPQIIAGRSSFPLFPRTMGMSMPHKQRRRHFNWKGVSFPRKEIQLLYHKPIQYYYSRKQ